MTQCCDKTHRKDLKNFSKIDAKSTSQLLRGSTKGTSNQYYNATRDDISPRNVTVSTRFLSDV